MKAAKAAPKLRCDEYKMDKKGKCPGDTGYVSFVKEDVPKDFAVSRSDVCVPTQLLMRDLYMTTIYLFMQHPGLRRRDEGQESRRRKINS
jgi:hypothetical protein